ncbi:MAG TPA: DUF6789 family protein [Longimicrobiaceae bacterium]|nr:DUF6789 family protein [Longimicrobiaceae bacterium]
METRNHGAAGDAAWRAVLATSMLASGIALVVSVLAGLPLWLSLGLLGAMAVSLVSLRWSQCDAEGRRLLRAQLRTGVVAGLAATAAYDASRLLLVHLGRLPLSPFETFGIFGQLIVGEGGPAWVTHGIGTAYHALNGTAFAIGYCFLLGGRSWKWGVAWGLGLEAGMLALYPGWLQLDAVLVEFTTMSFVGHLCYGSVLGWVSERRLRPHPLLPEADPPGG